jgi:hypothetical protein
MHDVVLVIAHWAARLVTGPNHAVSARDPVEGHSILDDRPFGAQPASNTRAGAAGARVAKTRSSNVWCGSWC